MLEEKLLVLRLRWPRYVLVGEESIGLAYCRVGVIGGVSFNVRAMVVESVLRWCDREDVEKYCAQVSGGLKVRDDSVAATSDKSVRWFNQ